MTQLALMYERRGRIFFSPESQTVAGFWVATPPIGTCPADAEPGDIAAAALKALSASTSDLPVPPRTTNVAAPLLEEAGVKSFGTFMKGATCVSFSRDDAAITVTPMRNNGAQEGFVFLEEFNVSVPDDDLDQLAAAITRARDQVS